MVEGTDPVGDDAGKTVDREVEAKLDELSDEILRLIHRELRRSIAT